MKKYVFIVLTICAVKVYAQQPAPDKNLQLQLTPQQKALMKQMGIDPSNSKKAAEQMKQLKKNGQMPDFKAQGQNMINNMMRDPANQKVDANPYPYFTNNADLIPPMDVKRISSITKKIFTNAEMLSNTQLLYSKMIVKIPAAEKAIITSVTAQQTASADLNSSAVTAMLQGHTQAAMGLAMKAVMANPGDLNCQNNLAALLNQNGYPENALPYLNSILQQVPNNSTVLNNKGYTWLALGMVDSAQNILRTAGKINPSNADTKVGEGVIEEKKGNKEEAGKKYEDAIVEAPASMIEILLGNSGRGNPYDNMTFDQIKSKLTIYEYFKKDWVTIPDLSNSVSGYDKDEDLQKAYSKMFESLGKKLQLIYDTIKNSTYNDIFIPTTKGEFNGKILQVITRGNAKIAPLYMSRIGLSEHLVAAKDKLTKAIAELSDITDFNIRCKKENALRDKYLEEVNPLIKKYFQQLNEKNRFWINAFITYSLLTNNQYKQHLLDVIFYVQKYIGEIAMGIAELETDSGCGDDLASLASISQIKEPPLPKLLCPIDINAKTPANNKTNINKAASGTLPNATVAIGSTDGGIAEPGKGGTPSLSCSQGDMSSSGINSQSTFGQVETAIAEEKVKAAIQAAKSEGENVSTEPNISEQPDNFTPAVQNLKTEEGQLTQNSSSNKSDYFDIGDKPIPALTKIVNKYKLLKWLQDNLGTDCDDLKKMDQNSPLPPSNNDIKQCLEQDVLDVQQLSEQLNKQSNPANAEKIAACKSLLDDMNSNLQSIDQKMKTEPNWINTSISPVPTIVNSLQSPGPNASFIKGLFN